MEYGLCRRFQEQPLRDGETPEEFDAEKYLAIGESDRMTLKFIKPRPRQLAPEQAEEGTESEE